MKVFNRVLSCLVIFMMLIVNNATINAATPQISLPDSSSAYVVGFTVKRTLKVKYSCKQPVNDPKISTNTIVGYCHTYAGRYRCKKKIDKKYYDAIIVKSAMEPVSFEDKKGNKRYSFSQGLRYRSTLFKNCTYQGNSPNNDTTGSTSYGIGFDVGYAQASVSGNVSISSKHCDVTDDSQPSQKSFNVYYDYKPNILDWDSSSSRNKALFKTTWQAATCEWTTTSKEYYRYLTTSAEFGVSSKKNGAGMYMSLSDYTSNLSTSYDLKYSF